MKKTLAALAVLGAFAGSAFAADVTVYGIVDLGVNYVHADDGVNDATDKFTMNSGTNSGSRFGLKGEEDLGGCCRYAQVRPSDPDDELDRYDRLDGRHGFRLLDGLERSPRSQDGDGRRLHAV